MISDKIIDNNIKDKIIRDTRFLLEEEYYEPKRTGNNFSSNYIEHENNGDRNKTLSIDEYFKEIRPYLT